MKPRIAAKHFIGTFSGQYHFMRLTDLMAKIRQRRIYICHTGQIMCYQGFFQVCSLCLIITGQIMMIGLQIRYHLFHKRMILRWLKLICLKILLISIKIKRKCRKSLSFFLQMPATDRRNQTRIDTPG